MEILILVILLVLIIGFASFCLFRFLILKKDLKKIYDQLDFINKKDTNITVVSFSRCKELLKLLEVINQHLLILKSQEAKFIHEEKELKNVIQNISHDLRTPITSILGYCQLMQKKGSLGEVEKNYVSIIDERLNTLKQLIENLFSYSLVYDHEVALDMKKENINLILEDSIAFFYEDFVSNNIQPKIYIPSKKIEKNVDKLILKRIFMNLLSNIVKYGHGECIITLTEEKIMFQNQTDIIDQIDIGKIFDRFFTIKRARNDGSMGIGLTITKTLIEKMGGSVEASLHDHLITFLIRL